MKRSATPLHSGSPTWAGVERMPSYLISAWNCLARYCEPQSCRRPRPRAIALPKPPMWPRTPLADRLQRRPAVALLRGVPADDLRGEVVDGREEPATALHLRCREAIGSRSMRVGRNDPRRAERLLSDQVDCFSGRPVTIECGRPWSSSSTRSPASSTAWLLERQERNLRSCRGRCGCAAQVANCSQTDALRGLRLLDCFCLRSREPSSDPQV